MRIDAIKRLANRPELQTYVRSLRETIPFSTSMDAWLLSFPRSGNTYLRRLLMAAQANVATPAIYRSEGHLEWDQWNHPYTIVHKTHEDHIIGEDDKIIFLVRDPRDTFISYMHMAHAKGQLPIEEASDLESHIEKFLSDWCELLEGVLRRKQALTFTARYEQLIAEPEQVLNRVLDFLDVRASTTIAVAVENASLEGWKRMAAPEWGFGGNYGEGTLWDIVNRNRGRSGVWRSVLTKEAVRIFEKCSCAHLAETFGYLQVS